MSAIGSCYVAVYTMVLLYILELVCADIVLVILCVPWQEPRRTVAVPKDCSQSLSQLFTCEVSSAGLVLHTLAPGYRSLSTHVFLLQSGQIKGKVSPA